MKLGGMNIEYRTVATEKINFPEETFDVIHHEEYKLNVHFTRDSWNGRLKACRGIGASLNEENLKSWEVEHIKILSQIAPEDLKLNTMRHLWD